MIVELKCQFCGRVGRVIVDDQYAALKDPQGLYNRYSCDPCGDFRQRKRQTFNKLKWICETLATGQVNGKEDLERVRKNLKTLLMRYAVNLAKHRGVDSPDWDEAILDALMAKPSSLSSVLATISGMIKQERLL